MCIRDRLPGGQGHRSPRLGHRQLFRVQANGADLDVYKRQGLLGGLAGAAHLRGDHQKLLKGGALRQQTGGQHLVVGGLSGLDLLQLFQDLLRGGKAADRCV